MNRSSMLVALAIGAALVAGCKGGGAEPEEVGTATSALGIQGLFPTGVDNTGTLLAAGTTDPHYSLMGSDPMYPGPAAVVANPPLNSNWVPATATSEWISVATGGRGSQTATDDYTLTFTIPATDDPTTATLAGTFYCSRGCTVLLNGHLVQTSVAPSWITPQILSITTGSLFVTGPNMLVFAVSTMNTDPQGLQVVSLSSTILPLGCTTDAECPGQWCDESTNVCTPLVPNGVVIPTDPSHTNPTLNGTCTAAAGSLVCVSGVCDPSDNECGYANGDGPCNGTNGGIVCRSGACSTNGLCEPAGGCNVDADCTGGNWCDESIHACMPKLPNGVLVPTDPPHTNPTLNSMCTAAAGALVCASGVCDPTDNECGLANGSGPCTVGTGPVVCRSGTCSTSGVCEPAGGCNVDTDCTGGDWCDETIHTCMPKLANGAPVPTDPPHTGPTLNGVCTAGAGSLVCASGVCDPSDNLCGLANGSGTCTVGTGPVVCRSGMCSTNGTCEPTGGCNVDADCQSGDWCNESIHTCTPKLMNGVPVPTDPPHTGPTLNGVCTAGAGSLVCVSGVCDPSDNLCGLANGDGTCTVGNGPVVCRSGMCSASGVCVPAGACNVDADCTGGNWCDESIHTCTPKIPNGGALPTDPPHTGPTLNGVCTGSAATLVCVSGVCDPTDNRCGFAVNDGPCTGPTGGVVCRSGACSVSGVCEPAGGCDVDADCTGGDWCNESIHSCVPKLANGVPVPTDPPHTGPTLNGTCTVAAGGLVCASGVCDPADNECGYADGDGTCTTGTGPIVCRSGMCNASGVCGPTIGCIVDDQCMGGEWCNESTHTCTPQLPNGVAVPTDPPHTSPTLNGTCTVGAGTLVCASGVCDIHDNECGYANGDGPCTGSDGDSVCRSTLCATTGPNMGVCVACLTDSQCSGATPACSTTTNTCVQCTASNTSACTDATPVCDATSSTCVPCNGDLGSTSTDPCAASSAPHCFAGGATSGTCGKCATNSDCAGDPAGIICNTTTGACGPGCMADSDCGGSMSGQICDTTTQLCGPGCRGMDGNGCPSGLTCSSTTSAAGMCVQCVTDANCGDSTSGQVCNAGMCEPGCRGMDGNGCPSGQMCSSTTSAIGMCNGGTGGGGTGGSNPTGGAGGQMDGFTASGNGLLCSARPGRDDDATGWLLGGLLGALVTLRRRRRSG